MDLALSHWGRVSSTMPPPRPLASQCLPVLESISCSWGRSINTGLKLGTKVGQFLLERGMDMIDISGILGLETYKGKLISLFSLLFNKKSLQKTAGSLGVPLGEPETEVFICL